MKAAIYINEGNTQVVLTPENEWEKAALKMIGSENQVQTFWGQFYECQGGWYRQPQYSDYAHESLMFRVAKPVTKELTEREL